MWANVAEASLQNGDLHLSRDDEDASKKIASNIRHVGMGFLFHKRKKKTKQNVVKRCSRLISSQNRYSKFTTIPPEDNTQS